jgi:hypothetical protein
VDTGGVFEADWSKERGTHEYGTWRHIALRFDASPIPLIHRLTDRPLLVDEHGLAVWGRGLYGDVSYAQLRAAADAGAVVGDPTQIYLNVRLGPAGGEMFVDWDSTLRLLRIALEVADAAAKIAGAAILINKVGQRLSGYRVAERKWKDWLKRNGVPDLFRERLRGEPCAPRDLAGFLGVTVSDARAILDLFGYAEGPTEAWVYVGGDELLGLPVENLSARVVTAFAREARHRFAAHDPSDAEVRALFEEILHQAVETGEITNLEYVEYLRRFDQ